MIISPKISSADFNKFKLTENSSDNTWKKAINIFDDRYTSRFINPILELSNNKKISIWEFSGFAIMALNCLLIETLNQFYYGVNDTNDLKKINQLHISIPSRMHL